MTTGGTVASLSVPATGAIRAQVAPDQLLAGVPELARHGPFHIEEIARVNGWNVTPAVMSSVADILERGLVRGDVQGAVVTHGTDTVEETAFFLDLVLGADKPVACAVAMRCGDQLNADGPRNIATAAAAVSDLRLRRFGVVVCVDGQLHAARWARKVHTSRLDAFESPGHGPLATADPTGLQTLGRPPVRVRIARSRALMPSVPVVCAYPCMDAKVLTAVLNATEARGVIVEGTGLGNLPGSLVPGIEAALQSGVVVVVSTRVLAGGTAPVYGGPGGAATLVGLGAVLAGPLSTGKARILLSLLLAASSSSLIVAKEFSERAAELA